MAIQFILMIAVLVAALVVGVAFIVRRLTEGRRRTTGETRGSAGTESLAANAWRDKFLFPLFVSIASGVVVAGVLYLLGLK
jgi:hypothetical protein